MSTAAEGEKPLRGRRAVVTGASRGIGAAVARALVAAGSRVALIARGAAALDDLVVDLGGEALAIPCDVTDRHAITRGAARTVNELGGAPDILVNSAGFFRLASFVDTTPSDFSESLAVNTLGPFLLTRTFLPEMLARHSGHVVTVGSVADRTILSGNAAYAASKFGVRAMHEVLLRELRGTGVRATLVSPGPTDTPLWDAYDPDHRNGFTPRAAMLQPVEVAAAILRAVTAPASVNVDEIRLSPSR